MLKFRVCLPFQQDSAYISEFLLKVGTVAGPCSAIKILEVKVGKYIYLFLPINFAGYIQLDIGQLLGPKILCGEVAALGGGGLAVLQPAATAQGNDGGE